MLLKIIPKKIKVWLLKRLYKDIAAEGRMGDTQLAHINDYEAGLLKSVGGSGTINPATGLVEFLGGGGGGSSTPASTTNETTSYSTNLPEYAQPFFEEQMKQGARLTYNTDSRGNVTGVKSAPVYKGPRVAGFLPDQTAAQAKTRALRDPTQIAQGTYALNRGLIGANTAMGGLGAARGFTPGTITSEDVTETITDDTLTTDKFTDPGIAASYMNPYQQQVVDVQTQEARRQADIAKAGRGMGSIGRGTFGGGRQALMESEADRALATQLGAIQARGSQQAYQQGQQAFTQDQARNLQMQKANQAADLQAQQLNQTGNQFTADLNKQLGLGGLQAQSTIGGQLGQLGALDQQTDLQRIQALAASGAEQQAMDQEYLNAAQQKYLEQANAQRAMLEYQSNILRGTAGALGSTQTQYAAAPSMASQIGGLGLAGLGLYNMMGRG